MFNAQCSMFNVKTASRLPIMQLNLLVYSLLPLCERCADCCQFHATVSSHLKYVCITIAGEPVHVLLRNDTTLLFTIHRYLIGIGTLVGGW